MPAASLTHQDCKCSPHKTPISRNLCVCTLGYNISSFWPGKTLRQAPLAPPWISSSSNCKCRSLPTRQPIKTEQPRTPRTQCFPALLHLAHRAPPLRGETCRAKNEYPFCTPAPSHNPPHHTSPAHSPTIAPPSTHYPFHQSPPSTTLSCYSPVTWTWWWGAYFTTPSNSVNSARAYC